MSADADDKVGGFFAYALTLATPGTQGPWFEKFVGALGLLADGIQEGAKQAVRLRFPGVCPPDALDANGGTFAMPRYPREGDGQYRGRLRFKWQTHEESGSRYGLQRAFQAAGLGVDIFEQWDIDLPTSDWMRCRFVLRWDGKARAVKTWRTRGVWGQSGKWQDARGGELAVLLAILRQHKPAHVIVDRVTVVLGGQIWGATPGKTWGSDATWQAGQAYQVAIL